MGYDSTTQGNWKGVYGTDGYDVVNDQVTLPTYANLTTTGASTWTWSGATTDPRALANAVTGSTTSVAAALYSSTSFTIGVNLTDGQAHQVSLYAIDWDAQGRSERIDVLDASGKVLNTQTLSSFTSGDYISWTLQGNVQIRVTALSGPNAVVSGVFFGNSPAPTPFTPTPSPSPTPTPTPPPTPTPTPTPTPSSTPTPTPTPSPTAVSVTTRNMTSFTELYIDGTSGDDNIALSESGNTFTIVADGTSQTISGTFGDIVIKGEGGNNTITVDSSVNIATLLYGGTGNATLVDKGTNFNTLVTIGGGASTLTGNGINTNYWANTGDTVNASTAETNAGDVHRVSGMISPALPSDSGTTYTLPNSSLWGTGPTFYDVNQRSIADCYYLATIQSLSFSNPSLLRTMAVDLGNGNYVVDFKRGGVNTFVEVNGNFGGGGAVVGASGNDWALVMEKAYAYFRTGANTYSSLNYGNSGVVMGDLGLNHNSLMASSAASTIYSTIASDLAAGKAVTASTTGSATGLVASHTYSVVSESKDASGTMWITLRNPWGFDGTGSDSNTSDGLVTVSMATFQSNVYWMDYQV